LQSFSPLPKFSDGCGSVNVCKNVKNAKKFDRADILQKIGNSNIS